MFVDKFQNREVLLGKPPKMVELKEVEGMEGIVTDQGRGTIFSYTTYHPDMVRHFYENFWLSSNEDDEPSAKSYVNGIEVFLTSSSMNQLLRLDDEQTKFRGLKAWT